MLTWVAKPTSDIFDQKSFSCRCSVSNVSRTWFYDFSRWHHSQTNPTHRQLQTNPYLKRNVFLRLDNLESANFVVAELDDGGDFHEGFVFFDQSMVRLFKDALCNGN